MEQQRAPAATGVNGAAPAASAPGISQQAASLTALLGSAAAGPSSQAAAFPPQLAAMFPAHAVGTAPGPSAGGFRPLGAPNQFFGTQPSLLTPSPARKGGASGPPRSGAASGKKQCNCKNSRCLKLYCECFASGRYCESCNCVTCLNNRENEATRQSAVEAILERNPNAFRPKIQGSEAEIAATRAAADGLAPRHTKGCNCKKSTCLKKYCECFQAAIYCSDMCKCVDCKNFEGSEARAQVMAVTEMGGIVSGAFGGASGTMPLASPSKRPRSGSQAALGAAGAPGAAGGLLRGSGSGTAPSLAGLLPGSQGQQLQQLLGGAGPGPGSMRLGLMPNSRQTVFQQALSESVPTPMIEDLCRLLLMTAEGEQQRLQRTAEAGGPTDVDTGGDGAGPGAPCTPEQLYEAQEKAVLEEFGSMLGKIVENVEARCSGVTAVSRAGTAGDSQQGTQGQAGAGGTASLPSGFQGQARPLGQDNALAAAAGTQPSAASAAAAAVAALTGLRPPFPGGNLPLGNANAAQSFAAALPGFNLPGGSGAGGQLGQGQGQAGFLAAAAAAAAAMVQAMQAGTTAAPPPLVQQPQPSFQQQLQAALAMQLQQQQRQGQGQGSNPGNAPSNGQ